jgi:hypothetical protein
MNSAASQALPQEAAPHISSSDVWVSIRLKFKAVSSSQN